MIGRKDKEDIFQYPVTGKLYNLTFFLTFNLKLKYLKVHIIKTGMEKTEMEKNCQIQKKLESLHSNLRELLRRFNCLNYKLYLPL